MRFFNQMKKAMLVMMASLFYFSSVFAETEASPESVTKDTDIVGVSYTLAGTYIAGGGKAYGDMPNAGMKIRTNRNSNAVTFAVNEGYVITAITVTGCANDDGTILITSATVDDSEKNLLSAPVELPAKSGSVDIALTGIEAASSVNFVCDNSNVVKNKQWVCTYVIEYKEAVTEPETPATEETQLTTDMFKTWDGTGADAQVTGAANCELHVGEQLGGGAMVYGTSTVYYLSYADLSAYAKMVIEGTPGVQLRVLMNRTEDESTFIEKTLVIGENGKGEVEFSDMEFVHLNAIKTGWGSTAGTITKMSLVKADSSDIIPPTEEPDSPITPETEGTPLTADMFKTWDSATNPTTGTNVSCEYTLNESTGVIYGDTYLGYLNYANLSGYDQLVVTVSEGTPRFLFNRIVDLGQDADNEAESQMIDIPSQTWCTERYLTVNGNTYTINLKKMVEEKGFAHLHGIKGANWTDVTVTSMVLVNDKDFVESQGLIYTQANDSYTITSYTAGLPANVVIPAELDGLPVTAIGAEAFANASVLKTLTIPTTVNMVGDKAFSGCHNLLVMEWNATAPMLAACFDAAEAYGNMLVFTSDATDVSFTGNVVANGTAERITLTDGLPFRNPQAFTAKHITYTRNFSKKTRTNVAAGWEGIVLPFAAQLIYHEEKGALAPFNSSAKGLPCWVAEWQLSSAAFILAQANLANQPFIMEVPNSDEYDDRYNIEGTVTFAAENATVYATTDMASATGNGYSLLGTYEGMTATDNIYALNDDAYTTGSEFFMPGGVFVANSRDIRPFEAYIHNNQLTRSRYLPVGGGTAQGMENLLQKDAEEGDNAWYTLQGIRLNGKPMQKGLYIHGNRVVRVR